MSESNDPNAAIVELLLRFENGDVSDEELEALCDALRNDPAQREALIQTLRTSQGLRAIGQKQAAEQSLQHRVAQEVQTAPVRVPSKARPNSTLLKLAAILVAGAFGVWGFVEFGLKNEGPVSEGPVVKSEDTRPFDPVVSVDTPTPIKTPVLPEKQIPEPMVVKVEPIDSTPAVSPDIVTPDKLVAQEEKPKPPVPNPTVPHDAPVLLGSSWKSEEQSASWSPKIELMSGDHFVETGLVKYRLANGVRLDVQGPTRFSIKSVHKVHLMSGKLAADVVPTAKGFAVETNGLNVVDLGTRFAVTANEKGDSAVHVYDGLVEATPKKSGGKTIQLKTGNTRRLNLRTNQVEPLLYQTSLFIPKPSWTGSIEDVSENVRVLESPPEELDHASLQGGFIVFQERSDLVLRRAFTPDLTESKIVVADQAGEIQPQSTIPAKTRVASYLVRLSGKDKKDAEGEAIIRFDSPVLGIIFNRNLLIATDDLLGAKQTNYSSLEMFRAPEKKDEIEITKDRRTVRLRFLTNGAFVDVARIIVARE